MKNITVYGNLAKDCEQRTSPNNGSDVCNFDIAVNDRRTKETYWFSCAYWGNGGKSVAPYLKKGQPVVVIGEFSWREYNDKKYLQINVNNVALAGKSRDSEYSEASMTTQERDQDHYVPDLDDEIPF